MGTHVTAMEEPFTDRFEAGRLLAEELRDLAGSDAVVLGLARGGVVVAFALAQELGLSLAALIVLAVLIPTWKSSRRWAALGFLAIGAVVLKVLVPGLLSTVMNLDFAVSGLDLQVPRTGLEAFPPSTLS